jgi:hypothetical protein
MLYLLFRQRHVPTAIKKTTDLKRTMLDARKAKEENRRRHTREGESKPKAERKSKHSVLSRKKWTLTDCGCLIIQRPWLQSRDRWLVVEGHVMDIDFVSMQPLAVQAGYCVPTDRTKILLGCLSFHVVLRH